MSMQESSEKTEGTGRSVKPNHRTTSSPRKVSTNRENARKSTGPKTPRGKSFSRRNAITHGLSARATDFEALLEDSQEYDDLHNGLRDEYQPVGWAEELEVKRIAQCWWRLQRAWRFENASNLVAQRGFGMKQLIEEDKSRKELDKSAEAMLVELRRAKQELLDTGEISDELKQRIFVLLPGLERLWLAGEKEAILALSSITKMIACLEQTGERESMKFLEACIGQNAIPNREDLDRLLRYDTKFDRSLNHALDRLEQLQRRRRGEPLLPPVSVRLTQ